jgi:hypothetical protein
MARQGSIPCIALPSGDFLFDPIELTRWMESLRGKRPLPEATHA